MEITAKEITFLKKEPKQAKDLPFHAKLAVGMNKTYGVEEVCQVKGDDVQVKLSSGAGVWWVYKPHWDGFEDRFNDAKSSIKTPPMGRNDVHVVISDYEALDKYVGQATCFDANGKEKWTIPALCKGVEGNGRTDVRSGDTPPGLFLAGVLTETRADEPLSIWNAYGRWFIDLVEQEGQEMKVDRAGIGWHGGGTAAPNPLADYQRLVPTLGCVRSHNKDLTKVVVPELKAAERDGGKMWITVVQY